MRLGLVDEWIDVIEGWGLTDMRCHQTIIPRGPAWRFQETTISDKGQAEGGASRMGQDPASVE
jgi:hypothetical protein